MTHDLNQLKKLGDEYEDLQNRLKEVRTGLHAEVVAAHRAGVKQVEIVKASRYTREAVRTLTQQADLEANPELAAQMGRAVAEPSTRIKRGRPERQE